MDERKPEQNLPQETEPEKKSGYTPATPAARIVAWAGVVVMVLLTLAYAYATATGGIFWF